MRYCRHLKGVGEHGMHISRMKSRQREDEKKRICIQSYGRLFVRTASSQLLDIILLCFALLCLQAPLSINKRLEGHPLSAMSFWWHLLLYKKSAIEACNLPYAVVNMTEKHLEKLHNDMKAPILLWRQADYSWIVTPEKINSILVSKDRDRTETHEWLKAI